MNPYDSKIELRTNGPNNFMLTSQNAFGAAPVKDRVTFVGRV